jgi:hypothetical protein
MALLRSTNVASWGAENITYLFLFFGNNCFFIKQCGHSIRRIAMKLQVLVGNRVIFLMASSKLT